MHPCKVYKSGTSLAVQWLGLRPSTAGGPGLIPGWGTKILQAVQCGQKKYTSQWILVYLQSCVTITTI